MINFVTNIPQHLRSGGFSAMNAAAFEALSNTRDVHYAGPINPPVTSWQKILSKGLRLSGARGSFFFFSPQRLQAIAHEVHIRCRADAKLDFFHGFTPWILTKPRRPYIAWSDCTFRDYIDIYHKRELFRCRDLERIEQAEAEWLRNACRVLFTSRWAAERAVNDYTLDPNSVGSVGIFGEIEMPSKDAYAGGKEFVFVSTNFEAKGGRIVLAAFRNVRERHPDVSLLVVGHRPSNISAQPGVEFIGFLKKEVPKQQQQFQNILARARALLHPTTSDVAPLTIIEAGYFGCPVISSRSFAIPEMVNDGQTGLLLEFPLQVPAVAGAMNWILEHDEEYADMRQAAWSKSRKEHSKQRFEQDLLSFVFEVRSGQEVLAG